MIRLFINKYTDKHIARNRELKKCFSFNENVFGVDNVISFNSRLSFFDFFGWLLPHGLEGTKAMIVPPLSIWIG
jgi:hypothetical protein